jgi:hypothetical protein
MLNVFLKGVDTRLEPFRLLATQEFPPLGKSAGSGFIVG